MSFDKPIIITSKLCVSYIDNKIVFVGLQIGTDPKTSREYGLNIAKKIKVHLQLNGKWSKNRELCIPVVPARYGKDKGLHVTIALSTHTDFDPDRIAESLNNSIIKEGQLYNLKLGNKPFFLSGNPLHAKETGCSLYMCLPIINVDDLNEIRRKLGLCPFPDKYKPHISIAGVKINK